MFDVLFNQASIGIIIVNSEGVIIKSNHFLQNLFGYVEEELLGNKIEKLIPARFANTHHSHRHQYTQNPKQRPMGIGMDLFALHKDGSEFPVEISLGNYNYKNQNYTVAFLNNVSKRENAKNEIVQLNNNLEDSIVARTRELSRTLQVLEHLNEKLETTLAQQKAILDNVPIMIFVTNKEGIIKFFNPEAERITGYESSEIINKLTPVIFHLENQMQICKEQLEAELSHNFENMFDVLKIKAERKEMYNHECVYKTKDGNLIDVAMTLTPIYNRNAAISGYLGVTMDITKRKDAENNLVGALKKEKKLGELKSRFVSMASHEFRTPLSTILSSAFLVEKYTTEEQQPKREKHLDRIVSSVNNLTNILNEFLSVGKIEEGKIGLTLTDFNIKTLIDTIIQEMNQSLKKGQQIKYEHSGDEWVRLDISILKNILMNLISNAIKFSFEDSLIEITTFTDNSTIKVEVKDHGIGIPDQDKNHLMERFFRANNANTIQGTGLGLYIVSKYAERMNGKITYSSEENKGTTFNIIFSKQKPLSHEINTVN